MGGDARVPPRPGGAGAASDPGLRRRSRWFAPKETTAGGGVSGGLRGAWSARDLRVWGLGASGRGSPGARRSRGRISKAGPGGGGAGPEEGPGRSPAGPSPRPWPRPPTRGVCAGWCRTAGCAPCARSCRRRGTRAARGRPPFSSCLQSFTASGNFPRSQFFSSGGQSLRASASALVLPMNIQD